MRWRAKSVLFECRSAVPGKFRRLINNATEPLDAHTDDGAQGAQADGAKRASGGAQRVENIKAPLWGFYIIINWWTFRF